MVPTWLSPTINVGEILTMLVTAGSFIFALGKLSQTLEAINRELAQLRDNFQLHAKEDHDNFTSMHESILSIAMKDSNNAPSR